MPQANATSPDFAGVNSITLSACACVGVRATPELVRTTLLHRAFMALRAAHHPCFRRGQPAGAHSRIPGDEPHRDEGC